MRKNILKDKSYNFDMMYKIIQVFGEREERICSFETILRSGTSVGANIEEANSGQSKKDFIAKLSVSLKEAKETHYWLRLLYDCDYINKNRFDSLLVDCNEIIALLSRIIKTTGENVKN
jgi:four helix bundle protein